MIALYWHDSDMAPYTFKLSALLETEQQAEACAIDMFARIHPEDPNFVIFLTDAAPGSPLPAAMRVHPAPVEEGLHETGFYGTLL